MEAVVANVNIEMISRPPAGGRKKAWITGRDLSDFEAALVPGLKKAGVEIIVFPMAARLFFASDNLPLASKGIVAHSISASSLHEDYHRPGDEMGKADIEHMTAVIKGIKNAVVDLANSEQRLAFNEKGKEALANRRR